MFSLDLRAHSEVGLVRKNNQDSVYASANLLVVADGMGGAAAGDLASAVAITEIAQVDRRVEGEQMLEVLSGAVRTGNRRLADLVAQDSSLEGMGTTVCGAMFSGTQLGVVHIGDSRGYLFRAGKLTQLTHDHSWVQSLVDEGKLLESDAARHPHRSLLLRVLNGHPDNTPDTMTVDLQLGDRVLFCSDGLSGMTTDAVIAQWIADDSLDTAVEGLIQAAHDGGASDNVSFVLAEIVPHDDQLDARPGVMLGAARTTHIPAPGEPVPEEALAKPEVDSERLRYLPSRHRRRWLPTLALFASLIVALALASGGAWMYAQSQYFVGWATTVDGDKVAVYRGLPDTILGVSLSQVEQTEPTLVADLPPYYQDRVRQTIDADSLDQAKATAYQLNLLALKCIAERAKAPAKPSTQPSTSASATHSPSHSASRSPSPSRPGSSASIASPTSSPTFETSAPAGSEDCS